MMATLTSFLLLCILGAVAAQGPAFPFYDNCRRKAQFTKYLVAVKPPVKRSDSRGVVYMSYCFDLSLKDATCKPEVFTAKGVKVTSRCCDMSFAKIKFYIDPVCRPQFMGSDLVVPQNTSLSRGVSPTFDKRPANYTEVKYTQFAPVAQKIVTGTRFCLNMKLAGPCNVTSLAGFTSPFNRAKGIFQAALYDKKKDNYECCPTFSFPLPAVQG